MFKVLIIDDEVIIAKGLQTKMDWKKLECEVCGIATDGLEGKRLIDELLPDIVISDIVMPGLNGLELSQYISSSHPSMVTIILTAYDDFKYAQKAIKFGVKEYILKPIDKNEIIRAVKKAVESLKESQSRKSDVNRLQGMVTEIKPIMNSTLLFNIALNGNSEIEILGEKLQYFDLNIGKVAAVVFELEPEAGKEINKLHGFALKNTIQSVFEKYGCRCDLKEKDRMFITLVHFNESLVNSVIQNRLKDIGNEIRHNVYESTGLQVSAGVGKVSKSIDEIHSFCLEAQEALHRRFFENSAGIFFIESGQREQNSPKEYVDLTGFYQKVAEGNTRQALELMEEILNDMKKKGDREHIMATASDMVRQLNSLIYASNGFLFQKLSLDSAADTHSFSSLSRYLEKAVEYACDQMVQKFSSAGNKIIRRVEKIVRERYGDKELSLQSVANELDLSLSYLSRLFKKEMDLNFMEYLTDIRISEAQKLLAATDMKNNEIADKVGFYDVGYFSQVFRKKCDMTPSEYKQKQGASGQKIKHK